jgi:hypothetical protein
LLDQLVPVMFLVRRAEGDQLEQGEPERVDVTAGVGLPVERLRRHVAKRAEQVAGVREVVRVIRLGQAEVGDPNDAVEVEQ